MSLKCIFRFESLDSTKSLNQRAEFLFKKGIYYGGNVTTDDAQVTQIVTVSPFRLISYDGMYVLSDSNIILSIGIGSFYIVCKAKYVVDDSPDIAVMAITHETYNSLTEDEKNEYVIFASATSSGTGVQITQTTVKEEISQLGRNPWRGYFTSESALASVTAVIGDMAMVKSNSSIGIELYVFNGNAWVNYGSANAIYESLVLHQNNVDIEIPHSKPVYDPNSTESITAKNRWQGAYHLNWNQLNSLRKFENNSDHGSEPVTETLTKNVTGTGHIQVVYLDYGDTKTLEIPNLTPVASLASLAQGKYFFDSSNGIVYIWATANANININYTYSYGERTVVSENEFVNLPRNSELMALRGNDYSDEEVKNQVPSTTNRFITENTPIPKRTVVNGTMTANGIELPAGLAIYLGSDNTSAFGYFDITSIEGHYGNNYYYPIVITGISKKVGNQYSGITLGTDTTNGWFYTTSNKTIVLSIDRSSSNFYSSSITVPNNGDIIPVTCYCKDGLGSTSVETFANNVSFYKNYLGRFHSIFLHSFGSLIIPDYDSYSKLSRGAVEFRRYVAHSYKTNLNVTGLEFTVTRDNSDYTLSVGYGPNQTSFVVNSSQELVIGTSSNSNLSISSSGELNLGTTYGNSVNIGQYNNSSEVVSIFGGNCVYVNTNQSNNIAKGKTYIGNASNETNIDGNPINIGTRNTNIDRIINLGLADRSTINVNSKYLGVDVYGIASIYSHNSGNTNYGLTLGYSNTSTNKRCIIYLDNSGLIVTKDNSEKISLNDTTIAFKNLKLIKFDVDDTIDSNYKFSVKSYDIEFTGTRDINTTSTRNTNIVANNYVYIDADEGVKINTSTSSNKKGNVSIGNGKGAIGLFGSNNAKIYNENYSTDSEKIYIGIDNTNAGSWAKSTVQLESSTTTNSDSISYLYLDAVKSGNDYEYAKIHSTVSGYISSVSIDCVKSSNSTDKTSLKLSNEKTNNKNSIELLVVSASRASNILVTSYGMTFNNTLYNYMASSNSSAVKIMAAHNTANKYEIEIGAVVNSSTSLTKGAIFGLYCQDNSSYSYSSYLEFKPNHSIDLVSDANINIETSTSMFLDGTSIRMKNVTNSRETAYVEVSYNSNGSTADDRNSVVLYAAGNSQGGNHSSITVKPSKISISYNPAAVGDKSVTVDDSSVKLNASISGASSGLVLQPTSLTLGRVAGDISQAIGMSDSNGVSISSVESNNSGQAIVLNQYGIGFSSKRPYQTGSLETSMLVRGGFQPSTTYFRVNNAQFIAGTATSIADLELYISDAFLFTIRTTNYYIPLIKVS